jgi:uncharacterized protein YabE (DUF348 family)
VKSYNAKFKIFFLSSFVLLILNVVGCSSSPKDFKEDSGLFKEVVLNDDGLVFRIKTKSSIVGEFLEEQKLNVNDKDQVFPEKDKKLYSSSIITLNRAKILTIADGKEKKEVSTSGRIVADALAENDIELGEDDMLSPSYNSPISSGGRIEIIRVEIKEEKVIKDIDFKKISEEDDELSWRTTKIKQKGVKGKKEVTYRVVSHNDKEISRKVLSEKIIQDPVPEINVQGTYMKLGKASTGGATWYSYTGTMAAANPWLPLGSYVKVTNIANGKSVVVKINDRGPFGKGRILDLDKVAFQKIADLGAGVIDVKMEPILN